MTEEESNENEIQARGNHEDENDLDETQPIENQVIENQTLENQEIEDQPNEDHPTENSPTEEQPVESQSPEDQPNEEQPTEEQPAESQSPGYQLSEHNTTEIEPTESSKNEDLLTESQSTESPENETQTTEDQPTESHETEDPPPEEQPNENQPNDSESTENQPIEDQPSDSSPPEDQPTESQPIESESTENQQTEDQLTDSSPSEDQTIESQSTEEQPSESLPIEDLSTDSSPPEDQPNESQSIESQSTENQEIEDNTSEDLPTEDQTDEEQPNELLSTEDQPFESLSTESQPTESPPPEDQLTEDHTTQIEPPENQLTDSPPSEDHIAEDHLTENQPNESITIGELSTESPPPEDQLTESQSIESQSTENLEIENNTTEELPLETQITETQTPNPPESQETESQPLEDQPNEDDTTETQPMEDQPAESQITESLTIEDQVKENQPTGFPPIVDQVIEDQPTESQPTENPAIEDQPTESQPTESLQTVSQVTETQTPESQVSEPQTSEIQPLENQPSGPQAAESQITESTSPEPQSAETQITETQTPETQDTENDATNDSIIEYVYSILIVDDELEVASSLRRTLLYAKQFKSEIQTVESGEAALAELEKKNYDMVLADYRMPGMTGTDLLHKVREKYPDIVRIIVTGFSDIEIIKEAVNKAEIHYYVEKPWENENIRSVVHEALDRKKQKDSLKNEYSTEKIMNWFMELYKDIESMGTDLSFIEQNLEIVKDAMESNDWAKAMSYINHSFNLMTECAEISTPKLEINVIETEQMPINKWNKLNFEIYNKGGADAINVQLIPQGEFQIKVSNIIPTIKVNETKMASIEIYPEKNGTFPLEIETLCKKPFDNTKHEYKDVFWIRIGEATGKTKLKRRFGYHNGYIKMDLNIINEDLGDIKDVRLELKYNEDELNLSHIRPKYNRMNKRFVLGDIKPHQGKYVEIFFDPLLCSKTTVSGKVIFKDWHDFEKTMMVPEQNIRILCPVLTTKDSIGLSELKKLLNSELKYHGNKIVTIPTGSNLDSSYKISKELVFKYNVKLINEMFNETPRRVETWFYGTTEDMKNRFVIKIRIDEDTESMEYFVASSNNAAITGFLTDYLSNLSKEFQERGIIQQPLKQIDNIALKERFISAKQCMFYKQIANLEPNLRGDLAKQIKYKSSPIAQKFENISKRELVNMARGRHVIMR